MDEKKIDFLLYSVPENVDYTTIPEELDLEDVLQERIDGLIELLSNENEVLQFDSARLLAHWGIDEGFDTLVLMIQIGISCLLLSVTGHLKQIRVSKKVMMHVRKSFLLWLELFVKHHRQIFLSVSCFGWSRKCSL